MSLGTVLLIILILLLLGALPTWPYSSGWGYYPSGGLGLVVLLLVILLLTGQNLAYGILATARRLQPNAQCSADFAFA
jgi:Protein of unknown function (DUF3309)